MITARTDVVGSLLRPVALLKARDDHAAGRLTPAEFKRIEDRAVDEAIRLQEEAGLAVVTDGEQRRLSFQSGLLESVEGAQPRGARSLPCGAAERRGRALGRSAPGARSSSV